MKKLLQLISSFLIVTPASSVISCTKNENWKIFQDITNDKNNNYMIMIDGADAQESKDFKSQLWNYLSSDPSKEAGNSDNSKLINIGLPHSTTWNNFVASDVVPQNSKIKGKDGAKPTLGDAGIKFVELKGEVASKLWDEDWAKNVMKWCANESWRTTTTDTKLTNASYTSKYEQKFENSKPLFLYISNGQYEGIHTFDGSWGNNKLAGDKSVNQGKVEAQVFYNWAYNQFIGLNGYGEDNPSTN